MSTTGLEVADVFRRHGDAYRRAHEGHMGRVERRVMSAIELCRTAELGGHTEVCTACGVIRCAYNSCRNRHCPKCQGQARIDWLAARQADLLPVPYFHVVFTLPPPVAEIAFQNKAVVYAILFKAAAETLRRIAADPAHLGAEIGLVAVLHTWGQTLTHHPHVHCIVPGGGPSLDGTRWTPCRRGFFLPVRVLSRLFRRLFLEELLAAFKAGKLGFFGQLADLAQPAAFIPHLRQLRRIEWVVYAKLPFGGPEQVLAYLSRYTHRVAIANSRLLDLSDDHVSFRWKDYRHHGKAKTMTLEAGEFIRRFLLHTLPDGFHRIRHYGFLANGHRAAKLTLCRKLLDVKPPCQTAILQPSPHPPNRSTAVSAAVEQCWCSSACRDNGRHVSRSGATVRDGEPVPPCPADPFNPTYVPDGIVADDVANAMRREVRTAATMPGRSLFSRQKRPFEKCQRRIHLPSLSPRPAVRLPTHTTVD